MAQCKRCDRGGLLFWTNSQGLCRPCEEDIRARVEEERERVKEALIWVRCNKSQEDKLLQLHRAMDGVRALQRYERLGCKSTRPSPAELAEILRRKAEEIRGEQAVLRSQDKRNESPSRARGGGGGRLAVDVGAPEQAWDRRRAARQTARFAVSVVDDGVRGRAEDVSVHGARFRSPVSHRSGSRVRLEFETPSGSVATEGVVRWSERAPSRSPSAEPCAMGVEWTKVPWDLLGHLPGKGAARSIRAIG